jgi:hypothetical protein
MITSCSIPRVSGPEKTRKVIFFVEIQLI